MKLDLTLYLVTDSTNLEEHAFLAKIEDACRGGVTLLQLREKNKTTRQYIELACKVKKITDAYAIPLIIDDRVDVAIASDAAGVHLGSEDISIENARNILGKNKMIGATAKTVDAALQAQKEGADYIGTGAIYPTTTKVKTQITSIETLKAICKQTDIPIGAIGGLHKDNCDILKGSGVQGICVVSAIMKQPDCYVATKDLKEKVQQILQVEQDAVCDI